jgi:hypothetical protein
VLICAELPFRIDKFGAVLVQMLYYPIEYMDFLDIFARTIQKPVLYKNLIAHLILPKVVVVKRIGTQIGMVLARIQGRYCGRKAVMTKLSRETWHRRCVNRSTLSGGAKMLGNASFVEIDLNAQVVKEKKVLGSNR